MPHVDLVDHPGCVGLVRCARTETGDLGRECDGWPSATGGACVHRLGLRCDCVAEQSA